MNNYGSWTLVSEPYISGKYTKAICVCVCGKKKEIHFSSLKTGKSKSCGCQRNTKLTHGQSKTVLYRLWKGIRSRCYNKNSQFYLFYGGRGIVMAKEWHDFARFKADVGDRPSDAHEIDRIDNNKGYEPGNIRWATRSEQVNNRSNTTYVSYLGKKTPLKFACSMAGVDYELVRLRMKRGWDFSKAVSTPKTCRGVHGQ